MAIKVSKFGGTSMADANAIRCVENILKSDRSRRFVVVSAPGKRFSADEKITDLLYKCNNEAIEKGNCSETFNKIRVRYTEICQKLNLTLDIKKELDKIESNINSRKSPDYAASCGEYLCAVVIAAYLNFTFIDAADIVKFNANGTFNEELTNDVAARYLKNIDYAVIPGFYGSKPDNSIKTFSRGGSDVSGAIIARAVEADIYENWTDVSGFMTADPRIVHNPETIELLSYKELRELSYMGASVLHPESIFPVKNKGIPINVRNTFAPDDKGTLIYKEVKHTGRLVTGIAGKKGFYSILIEKSMMNNEIGFARRILSIFERHGISIEHTPSGIDTYSIVISECEIKNKLDDVMRDISYEIQPDYLEVFKNLSLIATVGHGMAFKPGTAARLFKALSEDGINVRMIDQGSSELNIIVAVSDSDYEKAIMAIYHEFIDNEKV